MALDLISARFGTDPDSCALTGRPALGGAIPGLKPRAESCCPFGAKERRRILMFIFIARRRIALQVNFGISD